MPLLQVANRGGLLAQIDAVADTEAGYREGIQIEPSRRFL